MGDVAQFPDGEPPAGLAEGGRQLWAALISRDSTLSNASNPMRAIAIAVCRAKDRCDSIDEVVRAEGPAIEGRRGQPTSHPAWVEARRNDRLLVQLLASLRLPDPATGRRPQRRPPRGAYRPRN